MSENLVPITDLIKRPVKPGSRVSELDFNGLPEILQKEEVEVRTIRPHDQELWHSYGQLRAQIYIDREQFLPESAQNEYGEEFDDDDVRSTHIIVAKDGEAIGSTRLINRRDDNPLPVEKHFDIELDGPQLEVSRLIVDSKKAGKLNRIAFLGLLRSIMGEANRRDITYVHAIVEQKLIRHLKSVGMNCEVIAEPRFIEEYNSINTPIRINASTVIEDIARFDRMRENHLAPFFRLLRAHHGLGNAALSDLKPNPKQFERNLGFISSKEQLALQDASVAIAGTGGDGGELALGLARLGVSHFRLADPEAFGVENINRQAGSNYDTIERNKAEVIAEEIYKINPWAVIDVYPNGITPDNVEEFVSGTNLVFDETEYTMPQLGVMLARECRESGIPVMMALNVGHGSRVMTFDPNGRTFESWLGVDETASLDEIAKAKISLRKWIGRIPNYANMDLFSYVQNGNLSAPSVTTGVHLAAAGAIAQAEDVLLSEVSPYRKENVVYAPKMIFSDAKEKVTKVIDSESRFTFYSSALRALIRTKRGLNPLD